MYRIIILFILCQLIISCSNPLYTIDEKSRNDYSILGFVTVDSIEVQIVFNFDYNRQIKSEDIRFVDDAMVILKDSVKQSTIELVYDTGKNRYFAKNLDLSNTSKFSISVLSSKLSATSTFVEIPKPIAILETSQEEPLKNGLVSMNALIDWTPKSNECLETEARDINNDKLIIRPEDFDDLSQCFNNFSFTTIYYPRCFNLLDNVRINQSYFLKKIFKSKVCIPAKKMSFSACSKEYADFINSINFIDGFERAFINTGTTKTNIISENSTGYFYGKSTVVIDL